MNFEVARRNMVEQQVRTWEVLEPRVLDVLGRVPREDFVIPRYRKMAYTDTALPLERGQVMMKPVVEGRLLQALNPQPADDVLEIGTGSGYLTACLAELAGSVLSVDCDEGFIQSARRRLDGAAAKNVTVAHADAFDKEAMTAKVNGRRFDQIAVTGSAPSLPPAFLEWLKPGGQLFMVVGLQPAMEACVFRRLDGEGVATESLFETDLPRLRGAEDKDEFKL